MSVIFKEGTRKKTRKDHWCVACDRKIPAGSEAHWQSHKGDEWGCCTVYWHIDCTPDFYSDY